MMTKAKSQGNEQPESESNRRLDRRTLIGATALGVAAVGLPVPAAALEATTDESTVGAVWWSEYLTGDATKSSYFYSRVVGWRMKLVALDETSRLASPGEKAYIMMTTGSDEVAGFMRIADLEFKGARPGWFTYIRVDDVDEAVRRAAELGGRVILQPYDDAAEGSRVAIVEDLEGCMVGLVSAVKASLRATSGD